MHFGTLVLLAPRADAYNSLSFPPPTLATALPVLTTLVRDDEILCIRPKSRLLLLARPGAAQAEGMSRQ